MKLRINQIFEKCKCYILSVMKYKFFLYFMFFIGVFLSIYKINNQNEYLKEYINSQSEIIKRQSQSIDILNIEILKVSSIANNNANAYKELSEKTKKQIVNANVKRIEVQKDGESITNSEINKREYDRYDMLDKLNRLWNKYEK